MSFLKGSETNEPAGVLLNEYTANGNQAIQLGSELKPLVADFSRDGVDLQIQGDNGDFSVVKDYFSTYPGADLITEGGAKITADVVSRLAGPGPVAQSTSSQTDVSPIGQISGASGEIVIKHADGTTENAVDGSFVYKGDILETGSDGNFDIIFIDDTKFSMGPGGRAVLDDLIYNTDDTASNGMGISLLQGVFSFVSGNIAKDNHDSVSIKTPVGTIGIRGTAWSGKIAQLGEESLFTLFSGAIVVANEGGSELLTIAQQSVIVTSFSIPPSKPFVLAEEQLIDAYGKVLQLINPEWGQNDDDDDFGTDTGVLMFDDDEAGDEFSIASQPGIAADNDLDVADFDTDDAFEDDLGDDYADDFEEDEMDDVWDAEDEDDEDGFSAGESKGGFSSPAAAAGSAAVGGWAAPDQPWGMLWTSFVSVGALLSVLSAFVGVELVRTMWLWTQPGQPTSGFLGMLGGLCGK